MSEELQQLVSRVIDGRYRLDRLIAMGGMGAVFRATQLPLGYEVAVKVLHPHLSCDEATAKRFEREAYSASKLSHPNCVKVIDYGSTLDGITYMSMELLEGVELKTLLQAPMAPAVAVARMIQLLEGLGHAHENGIIHRDLKPANIFVTHDSRGREVLKIVDFGIARMLEERSVQEKLTQTGIVFGTPHYMSPEQATGGTADARSDIYAAGLIFYRMLAGRPPFQAEGAGELMRMQIVQPPDLLPHEVPRILAHVVTRMLEKDPAKRYASTREIVERLERMRPLLDGVHAPPPGPPPGAPLPGPQPDQSMMPAVARPSPDGDTAPMGAGSWQDAASASRAGRDVASMHAGPPRRPAVVPWLLMAVAAGVAVAAVGMLLWQRHLHETELERLRASDDASATVAKGEAVQVAEPDAAAGANGEASAPAAEVAAAPDETIALTIQTNVEASVLDAADFGVLGLTNTEDPVLLERGKERVELVLRAEGYADAFVEVSPDEDHMISIELKPLPPEPKRGKAKAAVGKAVAPDAVDPPVQKPARPPESLEGAELRDPFDG